MDFRALNTVVLQHASGYFCGDAMPIAPGFFLLVFCAAHQGTR